MFSLPWMKWFFGPHVHEAEGTMYDYVDHDLIFFILTSKRARAMHEFLLFISIYLKITGYGIVSILLKNIPISPT
jgi:hypothetical protein